ncbi:hypothetical protein O181_073730 [Austropuccinia psidii MF-1]|uniref:Retrotransposon gag domain-containing protein n=1 Tax=Austropuccinia psidii MF-1 TaxID=1389203 RepID=A0A9Q3F349_9BASI|nr:hypothetical protein [Austropuccinia psidii MF-1]
MPIKHSPPARQKRSQERTQVVLTPTPRAPLDGTPAVSQLRVHLDRGPSVEGAAPSRKEGRVPRRSISFSGVVGRFPGLSRTTLKGPGEDGTEGPTLAQSNKPVSHQSEPYLLAIMQQMTQIMANIQASRPPAFKTPSIKAPECFDRTQPFKVRSFIQSCQLIFHNDLANFSQDRKKFLYATSFLIGRAAKLIEPYLSDLTNHDSNYLLNSWSLFESQLFTLFWDPNEVRKAEAEFYCLIMKEGSHVSSYIAIIRSLVSRIVDWGERALIHHFRKGLPSRILDQLASHPSRIDSLQDLMDITLKLETRYHERENEKIHNQEKKPEASKSNFLILKVLQAQVKRERIFRRGTSPILLY